MVHGDRAVRMRIPHSPLDPLARVNWQTRDADGFTRVPD